MALENVMRVDNGNIIGPGMPETYPATQVMMSDGVTSVEDAFDGLKMYKKEISVTFDNRIYTGPFSISTETGGVINSSNIKGMVVVGVGVVMYPVLSSNKLQFYIYSNEVQNTTIPAECIFFYT